MLKSRISIFLILAILASTVLSAEQTAFPQTEFVANISKSIPDWRPQKAYNADEAQILTSVYEGLYVYDPLTLDPVNALAESESVSKDRLVWTFKIRQNARFENGEPITAEIIRNSWLKLLDPSISAPYASLLDPIKGVAAFRTGVSTDRSTVGITASDSKTLIVQLVAPAEYLRKILCHHAFSAIYPSQLNDSSKDTIPANYQPIASGAYKVKSISTDEIILEKNPQYWDAANVAIPSFKLILSEDGETLTSRFNRGEINWLAGSSSISKIIGSSTIHISPMFSTEYFFFRSTWGPGADSRVRNALLLAIPWTELRSNYLIPAKTLVFPIANYPQLDGIETQNIPDAKKKLAEAGIIDPSTLAPLIISIPDSEAFISLAKIIQKAWVDIGFKVDIRTTPYTTYYGTLKNNDYTIGITSWIGDFADPLSFLEMFRPASSLNDSGWNNPDFEALILSSSSLNVIKDRYAKLAEAEQLLLTDGVILPIAHNPSLNVIDTNGIAGWYTNALDIHPFKFIQFTQKKALPGVAMLTK